MRDPSKLNSHDGINSGGIVCFNIIEGVLSNVGTFKDRKGTYCRMDTNGVSNKGPKGLTKAFLNSSYIPALTAYEYEGHIITAWARPEFTNGSTSVGIVYKRARLGSIIQVQRIEGQLFETKEQAEQHGVELCKEWIDKQVRSELAATTKE
jgi:hypothetical protein